MKRKLFFVLFALVALASFQVSAQTHWWIKADTTGLNPDKPYSGNKTALVDWLIKGNAADKAAIDGPKNSLLDPGQCDKNQWIVTPVEASNRMVNITHVTNNGTKDSPLSYPYTYQGATNYWKQFEVVQFTDATGALTGTVGAPSTGWLTSPYMGFTRTVQVFNNSEAYEGYLMPAQGGDGISRQDTTSSMLMVVSDKDGNLLIKRFDDVFKATATIPAIPAGLNSPTVKVDSFTVFNFGANNAAVDPNYVATLQAMNWFSTPVINPTVLTNMGITEGAGDMHAIAVMQAGYSIKEGTNALDPTTTAFLSAINGGGTLKVLYFSSNSTLNLLSVTAEDMKNPAFVAANFTEYIGDPYSKDCDLARFQAEALDGTKYSNGLPYSENTTGTPYYFMFVQSATKGTVPNDGSIVPIVVDGTPAVPAVPATLSYKLYRVNGQDVQLYWPVYVKLQKPAGRWATAGDFTKCDYFQFTGSDGNKLSVPAATVNNTTGIRTADKAYDTFVVKQVDWVGMNTQSNANMFGTGGYPGGMNYYNTKFDPANGGGGTVGLQTGTAQDATGIIPLFTLSSPQAGCGVVSVSRVNYLDFQSQKDATYANQLEIRNYGQYFDQFGTAGDKWQSHDAVAGAEWDAHRADATKAGWPLLDEKRVATSLQKFAIWIDVCGNKTLYPAASYTWEYGYNKNTQVSKVLPNSVLLYNNTEITTTTGATSDGDKGWGTQIALWSGRTTNDNTYHWQTTTAPNIIQWEDNKTEYVKNTYSETCPPVGSNPIDGKFYFLQVNVDNTITPAANTPFGKAVAAGAYQEKGKVQYVLSVEVKNGVKHLIVLPKERVRTFGADATKPDGTPLNPKSLWYDATGGAGDYVGYKAIEQGSGNPILLVPPAALLPEYYMNNPYDSVNMAAHWGIYEDNGKYLLKNMLGDTLQYNLTGADVANIAGGYLPVSSQIASIPGQTFGGFSTEGGVSSQWFPQNPVLADNTTQNLWSISNIPGQGEGLFTLNLNKYTLELTGSWYQGTTIAIDNNAYWQHDVQLIAPAQTPMPWNGTPSLCPGGLTLTKKEIYYVPKYSASYGTETDMAVINTTDPNFKDGTMVQDSLTAYLYLNGFYGIKEALSVDNNLMLGRVTNEIGIDAAALTATAANTADLQFIPLTSVAKERNATIKLGQLDPHAIINSVDTLYGETYKWFIIKKGDQYLVYDTIASSRPGQEEYLKAAFTFQTTDVANATPVRLYQPLVGDKLQGNFIFEFNIAVNTYNKKADGTVTAYRNVWPDISGTGANMSGKRVFGKVGSQTNYIHGVVSKVDATRFTYTFKAPSKPDDCTCPQQFIDPTWMANNRLLGLSLNNQIWGLTSGKNLGFTTGDKNNEAVVDQTGYPVKLKFTYVDSIRPIDAAGHYVDRNGVKGEYRFKVTGDNNWHTVTSFKGDVAVPLYYIQNDKDEYLTVVDTTYAYSTNVTDPDVSGVNLAWKPKYQNTTAVKENQALQLFAISGSETTPDANGWYNDCHTFVYLPLASYKADYSVGRVVDKTHIFYNDSLGKGTSLPCVTDAPLNDVTTAYRVGYLNALGSPQQNLVVQNASGTKYTSVTAVEVKWQKSKYLVPSCFALIQDGQKTTGKYYPFNGAMLNSADSATMIAHWRMDVAKEDNMVTFKPELTQIYGHTINADADPQYNQNNLLGQYYFIKKLNSGVDANGFGWETWSVIDLSGITASNNWATPATKTLTLSCTSHSLPFFDLEAAGYDLTQKLAILETAITDRFLGTKVKDDNTTPTKIYRGGNFVGYRTYINEVVTGDFAGAGVEYLNIYPVYTRVLSGNETDGTLHKIPYYSFSVEKDGKEYFLNVENVAGKDSVSWRYLDPDTQVPALFGEANATNNLNKFKFCLPYRLAQDANGKWGYYTKMYGDPKQAYKGVYLQTLDVAQNDWPWLVVVGSGSHLVTAKQIQNTLLPNTSATLNWNIYSIDYKNIDPLQITSWIFGGNIPNGNVWVPIVGLVDTQPGVGTKDGSLTVVVADDNLGYSFIADVNHGTGTEYPDYGVLTGNKNDPGLTLHYDGKNMIGSYAVRPIWYYRIAIGDSLLTDATVTHPSWTYTWPTPTNVWHLGVFTKKINGTPYKTDWNITSDQGFNQSFGFRYVNDDEKDPLQSFYIVSNADCTNKPAKENQYRYLAEVNHHLVFLQGGTDLMKQYALVFQWGKVDSNGTYTDIQVVGQGGIYGVQGGVRVLNETGKVDIYSIDGRLIKSAILNGTAQTIDAPRGIAIVKTGSKVVKVVVQ